MLSTAAIDREDHAVRAAEARADAQVLRRLTHLILGGLVSTLLIIVFMLIASMHAVSTIDTAVSERERAQVSNYMAALPTGLDEVTLDAMATTLGLEGARLTTAARVAPDQIFVPLAIGSDRVVAWTPPPLGSKILAYVAPVRIGAGILFTALIVIIGWRVVSVSRRLDRRRAVATRLAHTDALTGLGNRRAFDAGLESRCALAAETGRGLVLILVDLDDFKSINDTFGHSVGDAVLQIVGRHLRENAEPDDLVVRLGGDEFAVVRDLVGLDDYLARIDRRFSMPIDIGGNRIKVSASIGMARNHDFPGEAGRLLQAADIALYRAKQSGPGNAEMAVPARRTAARPMHPTVSHAA